MLLLTPSPACELSKPAILTSLHDICEFAPISKAQTDEDNFGHFLCFSHNGKVRFGTHERGDLVRDCPWFSAIDILIGSAKPLHFKVGSLALIGHRAFTDLRRCKWEQSSVENSIRQNVCQRIRGNYGQYFHFTYLIFSYKLLVRYHVLWFELPSRKNWLVDGLIWVVVRNVVILEHLPVVFIVAGRQLPLTYSQIEAKNQ